MTTTTKDDFECVPPATDGITEVAWCPTADYLAVASWDSQVRVYEVQGATRGTIAKTAVPHDGPVFSVSWSLDGTRLASVGADKAIKILDLTNGQQYALQNAHEAPIRQCRWTVVNGVSVLVTGGWDRMVKYWQLQPGQPQPIQPMGQLQLPERCFAMDCQQSLLVIGTAERHVIIVDLAQNPLTPARPPQATPLKMQTRAIACFPDGQGFAVGSVEGRAAVQYIDPTRQTQNFAFKCHRDGTTSFGLNAIRFHPKYPGTFATAGSDGVIAFWDKESKQRLESLPAASSPISSIAFNRDGSLMAYAVSYDWSQGHEHYSSTAKNAVMVHRVAEPEVKPRTGASAFRRR